MKWKRQAELVKRHRVEMGLTQEKVGVYIGTTPTQNVSNVERNKCGVPLNHLYTYCSVLGIDKEAMIRVILLDYMELLNEEYQEGFVRGLKKFGDINEERRC